ncbi:MAG: S-layer homology domain-containing protein [Alicyclobacillus sp.]|nr:S-layer homology domain-containing protein [Alicyclobacillus sp.]
MAKHMPRWCALLSLTGLISGALTPGIAYADTLVNVGSSALSSSSGTSPMNQTATKTSESQAVAIAQKLLPIPRTLGAPQVSLSQNWMYHAGPVYNLAWVPVVNSKHPGLFYNATIDANTGEVLNFNSKSGNDFQLTNNISEADAEAKAKQIIANLASAHADEVSLDNSHPQPYGSGYVFTFVHLVNGVPAPFDNIVVGIDGNGQLSSYQLNWLDVQFPSAQPALSLSDAEADFEKNPPSQLQYVQVPQLGPEPPAYALAYTDSASESTMFNPYYSFGVPTQENLPWLDANTGQFLLPDGSSKSGMNQTSEIPVGSGGTGEWPKPLSQPLDASGAEQLARQVLNLSSDWQLQNSSQQTGPYQDSQEWDLQFQNKGNFLSVGVSANFGLVTHVNRGVPGVAVTADHSLAQSSLDEKAVSLVKSLLSSLSGTISLNPISAQIFGPQQGIQGYQIVAKLNGVAIQLGTLAITKQDGQLFNYWLNFNWSATLPDPSKAISAAEAWKDLVAQEPLRLEYVLPVKGIASQGSPEFASSARLVYGLKTTGTPGFIDAVTGQWVTFGMASQQATDIQGHYGEKEMSYLVARGILPVVDGKVHPDSVVTRGQFIEMLSKLGDVFYGGQDLGQVFQDVSQSSPYYDAVEQALRQGWLPASDKLNPDDPITRGQAAVWLTNWLGWKQVAAKPDLYQNPFADADSIPQSELGAAVLADKFGLIPHKDNNDFNANGSMTVADVAVALAHAAVVNNNE